MTAEELLAFATHAAANCPRREPQQSNSVEKGKASPKEECALPFVIQKYVDDPLLVQHFYKFDVRWWCVVTSLQPIRAYMLTDGYAKIASSVPYDSRDISNKCAHVTNNAIQKQCMKKTTTNRRRSLEFLLESSVRSSEFERTIFPIKTEVLFQGAKTILEKVLQASAWRLEARRYIEKVTAKTFQMLAIDVIYEKPDGKAMLLEINTNGYLRSGMMKIPQGRERLKELFRLTGFVGYPLEEVEAIQRTSSTREEVESKLEHRNRGEWISLFGS